MTEQGVTIYPGEGSIRVVYEYDSRLGVPRRDAIGHAPDETGRHRPLQYEAFVLRSGEWGRLKYNGRHTGEEGWWYDKWVFNIGLFPRWSPDIFLDTPPCASYSQMARLR